MLSVRNAILCALAVLVLSVAAGTISLLGPPDSNGLAIDSFGTRRDGFRAVCELLETFSVPVERRIEPPADDLSTSTTLVLWMPHDDLIANEPAYLERLLPWVERGGRMVIAIPPHDHNLRPAICTSGICGKTADVWSAVKVSGIRPISVSLTKSGSEKPKLEKDQEILFSGSARRERIRRSIEESFGMHSVQFTTVQATHSGSFEKLKTRVGRLQIPAESPGGFDIDSSADISGKIECERDQGDPWVIAAAVQRGQGEIVFVAEPMLLMNGSLGQDDNSVLAYDLLAEGGRRVAFDEFYHGLSVRGNPLWLLTRATYATVIAAILALVALELWRRAIFLGPPRNLPVRNRRTIQEYIDAMARFLNHGRASRPFLLKEVRAGTLRTINERLGLSYAVHDLEQIATAMAKRSTTDADQFREAMKLFDSALAKGSSLSETNAVRALQRISRCL